MRAINTHVHLGESRVTELAFTEAEILATHEKDGVDVSLVLPIPHTMPDQKAAHDRISRLMQQYPGKFFGVMDESPALEDERYWQEADRCFKKLGFVAVKLHTYLQPVNPVGRFATKVYEVAKHYKVPVIVHTGPGIPFSLPALQIRRAREFPEVPIILAHAGANIFSDEAIMAAEMCENILLEPTWCGTVRMKEIVTKIGSQRVLFASDAPLNAAAQLASFRTIGLTDAQLEDCLYRTALRVFGLPVKE